MCNLCQPLTFVITLTLAFTSPACTERPDLRDRQVVGLDDVPMQRDAGVEGVPSADGASLPAPTRDTSPAPAP
ncbi:MAG: hypothetical protein JRH20_32195, partial [Deltaproteobacteria bacterium]|nr:hypothetical protein [Deltaproteobacteria bacterium]